MEEVYELGFWLRSLVWLKRCHRPIMMKPMPGATWPTLEPIVGAMQRFLAMCKRSEVQIPLVDRRVEIA